MKLQIRATACWVGTAARGRYTHRHRKEGKKEMGPQQTRVRRQQAKASSHMKLLGWPEPLAGRIDIREGQTRETLPWLKGI